MSKRCLIVAGYLLMMMGCVLICQYAYPHIARDVECSICITRLDLVRDVNYLVVYWRTAGDKGLSEKRKLAVPVRPGLQHFKLSRDACEVRIDIGLKCLSKDLKTSPGVTFTFAGRSVILDSGFMKTWKAMPSVISFPICEGEVFCDGRCWTDWSVVIAYAFLLLLILDCLVRGIVVCPRLVIIGGFIVLLLFPIFRISDANENAEENRTLAPLPSPDDFNPDDPSAFFKLAENAFNDRFNGRMTLIRIRDIMKLALSSANSPRACAGKSGWLFLRSTLPGKRIPPRSKKEDVLRYLNSINDYAVKHGKKFIVLIAPDKSRIYEEYLKDYDSDWLKRNSTNETDVFLCYLRDNCSFPIIYPREILKSAKQKSDCALYWMYDTHWNWEGAYWGGYVPVMQSLGRDAGGIGVSWKQCERRIGAKEDLAGTFAYYPNWLLKTQHFKAPIYAKASPLRRVMEVNKSKQPSLIETQCAEGCGNLFCLRDSFMQASEDYFARAFNKCRFVWRREFRADDKKDLIESDVILLEIVERNISTLGYLHLPTEVK